MIFKVENIHEDKLDAPQSFSREDQYPGFL